MSDLTLKFDDLPNTGAQFSREARPLKRGAVSERGQAAHMLEARERRQAHRLHSDPLAKSHHSSLTCAFVSQVYPSFNPPPTICAFCHVSVVQIFVNTFFLHLFSDLSVTSCL